MLVNKSKIQSYTYSVDFSTPISFLCKLINDIGSNIISDFTLESVFNKAFITEIGYRFDSNNISIDELASNIAEHYQTVLFDSIDISRTNILFIYKSERIIFCYDKDEKFVKNAVNALLTQQEVFIKLLSQVDDQKLRSTLERLQVLNFSELFRNVFSVNIKKDVLVPYIPLEYIDDSFTADDYIDLNDVRVNNLKFKSELREISQGTDISLIKLNSSSNSNLSIGIKYNDYLFSISNFDLLPIIKKEYLIDYYWLLFNKVFSEKTNKSQGINFKNDILSDFKSRMTNKKMSQMLTFLVKNHYIHKNDIKNYPQYKNYFEEVSGIKDLKGITDFEFYISRSEGKTALGIYTNEKVGNSFNLLHWIDNNNTSNSLTHFRDADPPKKLAITETHILKPEVAFYYLTNYYEDFFEKAIKSTGKEYIRNFDLYADNTQIGEIDFLVKSNQKICFIETKTKLTSFYIDEYIIKCDKILSQIHEMGIIIDVKFFIFASLSDENCNNKKYFIDESKKKHYNSERAGINTIPYYFDVPIPKFKGSKLTCIAEPDFTKLKAILKRI